MALMNKTLSIHLKASNGTEFGRESNDRIPKAREVGGFNFRFASTVILIFIFSKASILM